MTLSELLKEYRKKNELSQRQFANKCGISNAHISMIENNMNPKTGQPLTPSLPMLKKIAGGMNLSLDDLFSLTDDFMVDLSNSSSNQAKILLDPDVQELATQIQKLDAEDRAEIRGEVRGMLRADKYKQDAADTA